MNEIRTREASDIPGASFAELSESRIGPYRRFLRRHPVLLDLGVVLLFLLASSLEIVSSVERGAWPVIVLIALLGGVLFLRRRFALGVLATVFALDSAATVFDAAYAGNNIGLWIALYTAATRYAARRMIIMTVLISAVQTLVFSVFVFPQLLTDSAAELRSITELGGSNAVYLISVGATTLMNIVVVGIGAAIRNNRLHDAELANWAARAQKLAQAGERNRIAREMHDVVAHSLSVMIALSDGAAVVIKRDPDRASQVLHELSATGRGALADMRRVIGVLRAGDAGLRSPQPAAGSLQDMLEGFRVAGLPLTFTQTGPQLPEDTTFQLTVYRIVQESLTNVLRYSRSVTRVGVEIESQDGTARLRITDNGAQTGPRRETIGSGQGVRGMAERAALFGGSVYAGPGPHGGWIVHAILPFPEHQTGTTKAPSNEGSHEV